MPISSIQLWADSVGKGVIYDESRRRYAISPARFAVTLADTLSAQVVNHSRMGATVCDGYAAFLETPPVAASIAIISYGGNDCDMPWAAISQDPDGEHKARTPLVDFELRLTDFVWQVRARDMKPLLVTPPPLIADRYFDWVCTGLDRGAVLRFLGDVQHIYRWHERYAIAMRRVAERTSCALFDLRDIFLADMHTPDLFCVDGIHPNERGHALIAQAVLAARDGLVASIETAEQQYHFASHLA